MPRTSAPPEIPSLLRRYLESYALNTTGITDHRTIYQAAGIAKNTGDAYERLLRNLLVIESLPASAPKRTDASHLAWLRDELGNRFLGGAVLHTGPFPFMLDDRIAAVPIATLWT